MSEKNKSSSREFDVVVWGATGFAGRLVAETMARLDAPVRWAMAGRNRGKLERVRDEIAAEVPAISKIPLLEANADDVDSVESLAAKTRVVATTVGPYGLYGKNLLAACVHQGTDYCDLTGETPFIRWAIDEYNEAAKKSGTRIVPTCGFDSIPSDLGVFFLAEKAREQGRKLAEVRGFVVDAKGGTSGGTIASMLLISELMMKDRSIVKLMQDPYALSPDRARDLDTDENDRLSPRFDASLDRWTAPWIMGSINTRVVRRSNALFDHAYGRHFRYSEELAMPMGRLGFVPGLFVSGAMLAGLSLLAIPPARRYLSKLVPAPGEGPSKEARESGRFTLRFLGRLEGDEKPSLSVRVSGRGDPGYLSTSRMLAQSALCLAQDPVRPGFEGGILTPATAMGMQLVERLQQHAEITFAAERL
jgi:short subunit dehydrogenase-like uncharacterized protein